MTVDAPVSIARTGVFGAGLTFEELAAFADEVRAACADHGLVAGALQSEVRFQSGLTKLSVPLTAKHQEAPDGPTRSND